MEDAAVRATTTTATLEAAAVPGTWQRSQDPNIADASYQVINAVVNTGTGFVAAGFDSSGLDADAAVWMSTNGDEWERIVVPALGGAGTQTIQALALGGPGIIAVGLDSSSGDIDGAVWASAHGRDWVRVTDPVFDRDDDQEIRAVVATEFGFVAAGHDGYDGEVDAAVWISSDGLTWERVRDAALGGFGQQRISSLDVGPNGIVAGGTNYVPNQFGLFNLDARIWTSPDGRDWSFVDDDETFGGPGWQFISAVIVGPDGFVAAGTDIRGTPGTHNDAAVWVSTDGVVWHQVEEEVFQVPGVQRISALIDGPEGIVAVGYDSGDGGQRLPAVWISANGRGWMRVEDPALDEPGHRWMNAIAIGGPGLVAVGADGTSLVGDPAVWLYTLLTG